ASISALGRYIAWFDLKTQQYFVYNGSIHKVSGTIHTRLADEQNDVPDEPEPYGIAGWTKDDAALWVYDRYDIWSLDLKGGAQHLTNGRKARNQYRYIALDKDEHAIDTRKPVWLDVFNDSTKDAGFAQLNEKAQLGPFAFRRLIKAKNAEEYLFTR